eukprot:3147390-Prymnesium_polylepis.1
MLIPTQQRDPQWAGTTVHTRLTHPQAPAHASSGEQHGQSRALQPLVIPAAFAHTPLALLTQPILTVLRRLV